MQTTVEQRLSVTLNDIMPVDFSTVDSQLDSIDEELGLDMSFETDEDRLDAMESHFALRFLS